MSGVLVTGMSGTGKSSALAELGRRGYRVVDTDDPGWRKYREYVESSDEVRRAVTIGVVLLVAGGRAGRAQRSQRHQLSTLCSRLPGPRTVHQSPTFGSL